MRWRIIFVSLCLLVPLFFLFSLQFGKNIKKVPFVLGGKKAPSFSAVTLLGKTMDAKDFANKPLVINFWSTWCVPCKDELPSMQKLYESLRFDGFEIIAISIDRENKEKIKKYVKKYSLTFPVLLDPSQKVRKNYYIMGLPTSYLIGSDGKLKGFISGARNWDNAISKNMFSDLID